ncbi:DUF6310 domain-containing protein [Myxococcus sp. CA033]|uniref:DUF6310 domain-containing protein n=1 Tax=Myxococcus sp. CA033 TaxID=2741516 RepID=UPI00352C823A
MASAGAVAVPAMVGICLLSQPYIVVGAVVVIGIVVLAVAIQEELEAYELRGHHSDEAKPVAQAEPAPWEPWAKREPKPEPSGQDSLPPLPPEPSGQERRPDCTPRPVPHLGGDALHNKCADRVPRNDFRGSDALVNGKHFDALQLQERVLWEVKTDNFDTYSVYLQRTVPDRQVRELRRERDLARACGFDFRVGVRSPEHQAALERLDGTLEIVVMDWC